MLVPRIGNFKDKLNISESFGVHKSTETGGVRTAAYIMRTAIKQNKHKK